MFQRSFRPMALLLCLFLLLAALAPGMREGQETLAQLATRANRSSTTSATVRLTNTSTVPAKIQFVSTGSMQTARAYFSTTQLSDGRVLVAGGLTNMDPRTTNLAEVYLPQAGVFMPTGNLLVPRAYHKAVLLQNGKVLIAGGQGPYGSIDSAELYDATTGVFTPTGTMGRGLVQSTATLLPNGRVLFAGGFSGARNFSWAEVYDPVTGRFSPTGSLVTPRHYHTATLLPNGKVLIAGGFDGNGAVSDSAELYDPTTGVFTTTGRMQERRTFHIASLLPDGTVLLVGGSPGLTPPEIYDPATGTFTAINALSVTTNAVASPTYVELPGDVLLIVGRSANGTGPYRVLFDYAWKAQQFAAIGQLQTARFYGGAERLTTTEILVAGGEPETGGSTLASAERGSYLPSNRFTGTLVLPTGWTNTQTISLTVEADASDAHVQAYQIAVDGIAASWFPISTTMPISQAVDVGADGKSKVLSLRLKDMYGQEATVVSGTIDLDTSPPISTIDDLPPSSSATINLSWSGYDTLSGIASYDLDVQAGEQAAWTPVLTKTTMVATTYMGVPGTTYYFRVRARDAAGNVEAWPASYDAMTTVPIPTPTPTPTASSTPTSTPAAYRYVPFLRMDPTFTPTNTRPPTRTPTKTRVPTRTATPRPSWCNGSYPTVCIPSPPPDLDCPDIPYRNFVVLPPDPHRFDSDNDGVGCEG